MVHNNNWLQSLSHSFSNTPIVRIILYVVLCYNMVEDDEQPHFIFLS